MKNAASRKLRNILVRLLAFVLMAALCPVTALGDGVYTPSYPINAYVQVIYATPEGNLGAEQVSVSPANNVVSPNPSYVPAGYEGVNVNPVKLIFNSMGQPIPAVIYFTYQRNAAHTVLVKYATVEGVFASNSVYVTPNANVLTPDPAMVPDGYLPFGNNRAIISFDQNGKPTRSEVTFYYYKPQSNNTVTQPVVTQIPQPTAPVPNMTADQVVATWSLPGQLVRYGSYEQDNNLNNGTEPVEWYVLRAQAGRALLVSRHALFPRTYHSKWTDVNWADCDLRAYLNDTFYNECFTPYEKMAIVQATLKTNYVGSTVGSQDYVFLLDAEEAKHLSKDLLLCMPTAYAKSKSISTDNGYCYWWLRDTTNRKSDANRVHPNGGVYEYGGNTNATGVGIRPAIWVDIRQAFGYR